MMCPYGDIVSGERSVDNELALRYTDTYRSLIYSDWYYGENV